VPRSTPPALVLFGPDKKYGARKQATFKTYKYYIVHGRKKISTGFGIDQSKQAQKAIDDYRRTADKSVKSNTVSDYLFEYQTRMEAKGKRTQILVIKHLRAHLGNQKLSDFDARSATKLREKLVAKGLGPSSVRKYMSALKTGLKGAGIDLSTVEMPQDADPRARWLTKNEVATVLRWARRAPRGKHLVGYTLLTIAFACRREALLTMRFAPHQEGGYFDLDRGIADFRDPSKPKSKKRRVLTTIPKHTMPLLRRLKRLSRSGYAVEYQGRPIKSINNVWPKMCSETGFDDVHPHDLVHTSISWQLQAGFDIFSVAKATSRTVAIIDSVYGHLALNRGQEPDRKLRRRFQ
jgi:integrase